MGHNFTTTKLYNTAVNNFQQSIFNKRFNKIHKRKVK